tara:strand:+ start:129 stop:440 length:312 start_codon:yes stop_codon:yes gene_type:complete
MKKVFVIIPIFFLILITSLIKNSTKKIEEDIFVLNENILKLNIQLDYLKLEYDYLGSSEKLMDYQKLYFENKLDKKEIDKIKSVDFSEERIVINETLISKSDE